MSKPQDRLKLLIKSLNMTQKEFATKAGLRNEYISRYIKGVCIPGRATLTKIANTYNIDPGWLMGFGPDDLIER